MRKCLLILNANFRNMKFPLSDCLRFLYLWNIFRNLQYYSIFKSIELIQHTNSCWFRWDLEIFSKFTIKIRITTFSLATFKQNKLLYFSICTIWIKQVNFYKQIFFSTFCPHPAKNVEMMIQIAARKVFISFHSTQLWMKLKLKLTDFLLNIFFKLQLK